MCGGVGGSNKETLCTIETIEKTSASEKRFRTDPSKKESCAASKHYLTIVVFHMKFYETLRRHFVINSILNIQSCKILYVHVH